MDHLVTMQQSPRRAGHQTMGPPPPREKKPLVSAKAMQKPMTEEALPVPEVDKVKELEHRLSQVGNAGDLNFLFTLMTELKKLEVERENLKASLRDNEARFHSLQAEHSQQIDLRENKLKELVATAYLSLPEDRQAALQYYLDRDKSRIDILTTLRAAQIEIARLRASEQAVKIPAPEGRVCLVFTDVQDSTSLWDANPDVMGAALDVHNSLMRTFITRYRGYEVKTEGDAFMIAFSDPIDALQWCLDIQVSLTLCDWPPELLENPSACIERDEVSQRVLYSGLRVRIGAHVGNPLCTKDPNTGRMDYFGPDVNRAARVSGAAHGGQVIVSKDIFDLVQDHLEDRLDNPIVTDLGSHKMKGLRVDTELIQLVPQHLAGRKFAPVKTVTTSLMQMEKVHASKDPLASMGFDQAPPMGRAAIVITNIMGGQKFWEEKPSDMAKAFEMHGNVLRDNTRKFKGYVVKSEGDKHLIAFSDVAKAVSFALAVQEELLACNWPSALEDFPTAARVHNDAGDLLFAGLRVAIGINFGEPICRPNPSTKRMDYTGIVVNTTARVVGAATGGQIIVTDRVDEELKKEQGWQAVAIECETQDLGTHAFHGIKQPARLIQVLPRSLLGREFPPPKTLSTAAALKSKAAGEEVDPARDASKAPVSDVTFVVSKVENLDHLWEVLPSETRVALDLYIDLIRSGLRQFSGYEVDSTNGRFVCAFHNAIDASSFSLYVQRKLLDIKWPYGLRESSVTGDEFDAAGNILNAGLRVAMGIHTEDPVASIDEVTGTMLYHGHAVPTLNAIGEAAHGGQILMDKASYSAVVTNQEELGSPQMRMLGQHELPGVSRPEVLTEMLPRDLAGRVFPEPHTLTVAQQARRSFLQEAQVAATAAMTQQQKNEKVAPWGDIFVVMVDVGDAEKLWLGDPTGMLQGSRVFVAVIRDHIRRYGGFEISNHELMFVVAFQKASKAFNFALDVHSNLLRAAWPQSLLAIPEATQVYDGDGEVVLNGLRARISINYGKPTRSLDPSTKRDTFIGSVVDNCARVLHAARPGQTILERSARIHVTNTLRKELVEDVEVKSMGEHLLTGLPTPLQLFLFSSVPLLGRPFQALETATNQLAGLKKKSEGLKKRLKEIEKEEKMARKSENLSVIAAVQARASIIKEQLADLEATSENIKDVTIRAEASDDRNLQALVSKQHDLLSIVYPNASKANDDDGVGDIDDLAQLGADLTIMNQIKLLRNEALMFEQNLSRVCPTDKDREDMLTKALRVLFRRLGILYSMCPVLEKGIERVSDQVDFLQHVLPKGRSRHGRGRSTVSKGMGRTGPNLEELDASEIDTFRRHIESMFGAQGPESGSRKEGSKNRKNRLRSAPGHRAGYESFMAAQSMMSLVEQASSAVQYKFPKGKKLQSRPNSSNRYQSVRAPMIPGSAVIDLAAVSREASRNRVDDSDGSDDVNLANSRHTGSNTSQDSRNPRRRRSAGRSGRQRRRSADKRRKEPPIENPVAPQLGFRPRRMDSDSSIASDASSVSNMSVRSGTGQTAGHILNLSDRGPKPGSKSKRRPRSSVQKRHSNHVTRSPSEILRPVREMESSASQLKLAASTGNSKSKGKLRLGTGVTIGGTFKSPPSQRVGNNDGTAGTAGTGRDDTPGDSDARAKDGKFVSDSHLGSTTNVGTQGLLRIPEGEEEEEEKSSPTVPLKHPMRMDPLTESAPVALMTDTLSPVRSSKSAETILGSEPSELGEPGNLMVVSGSSAKASVGTNFDQVSAMAEEFDISDSEDSGDDESADSLRNYRPTSGGKRAAPPASERRPSRVRKTRSTGSHSVVDSPAPDHDHDSDKSLVESSAALIGAVRAVLSRASQNSADEDSRLGDWPSSSASGERDHAEDEEDEEDEDDNVWFTKGVRIDNVDLGPLFHRAFEIRKFRVGYLFERLKLLRDLKYVQRDADRVFDGIPYSSKINRQRKAYVAFRERVLVRRLQDVMVTIESIHDESYDLRKSTMMALNLLLPQFGGPSQQHYEQQQYRQQEQQRLNRMGSQRQRGSVANLQRPSGAGFKITKLKGPSRSGSETHLGDPQQVAVRRASASMSQLYEHSATPGYRGQPGGMQGSYTGAPSRHAGQGRPRYTSVDASDLDDDDGASEASRASRRSGIYVHNRNKSSMKSLTHRGRQDSDLDSSGYHDSREPTYATPQTFTGGHSRHRVISDPRGDGPAALSIGKSFCAISKLENPVFLPQSAPTPRRTVGEGLSMPAEPTQFSKGLSPSTPRNAPPANPSPRRGQMEHARILTTKELQDMRNPQSPRINNLKVRRGLSMAHPVNQRTVQHDTGTESPRNMLGAPLSGKAPMVEREYAPSSFR